MPSNAETITDTNKPSRDKDRRNKDDDKGASSSKRKSSRDHLSGSSRSSPSRSARSSPTRKDARKSSSSNTRTSGISSSARSSDDEVKEREKRRRSEANQTAKEGLLNTTDGGRSSRNRDSDTKEKEKSRRTSSQPVTPGATSVRSSISDRASRKISTSDSRTSDSKIKDRARSSSASASTPGASSMSRSSRERAKKELSKGRTSSKSSSQNHAPPLPPMESSEGEAELPSALEAEAAQDVQEIVQDALRQQREEWKQEREREQEENRQVIIAQPDRRYKKKYLFAGAFCFLLLIGGAVALAVILIAAKAPTVIVISPPSEDDCRAVASGMVPSAYSDIDPTTVGVELEFAVTSDEVNISLLQTLLEYKMKESVLPALIGCPSDLTFNSNIDIVAVIMNTITGTELAECTQDSDKLCTTVSFEMDVYAKDRDQAGSGDQALVDVVGEFFQNEDVPELLDLDTAVEDVYFNYAVEIVPSESPSASPTSASPSNHNSTLKENCLAIANGDGIKGLDADKAALQEYNVLLDVTLDDEISDLSPVTMQLQRKIQQVIMPPLAGCPAEEDGLHQETNVFHALVDDVKHDSNSSCLEEESKSPCYRYDIQLHLSVPALAKSADFSREIMAEFQEAPLVEQLGLTLPFVQITFVQVVAQAPTSSPSASTSQSPTFAPVTFPTTKAPTRTPITLSSPAPTRTPSLIVPTTSPVTYPTTPSPTRSASAPSQVPTTSPVTFPTTKSPMRSPTPRPTLIPSAGPSATASSDPTFAPVAFPTTEAPTRSPSDAPSKHPTATPSVKPSSVPTLAPSIGPTPKPSSLPSRLPSQQPSLRPTPVPTPPPTPPTPPPTPVPTPPPTTICFQTNGDLRNAVQTPLGFPNWNSPSIVAQYGPVGDWCFGPAVTSMNQLFQQQTSFNEDISRWDVSGITSMQQVFIGASSFNRNIGNWDTSSVTSMWAMFMDATSFNQDISNWDVSSLTDTRGMFSGASSFNQNLCAWGQRITITNSADVAWMFNSATSCPSTSNPNLSASPRGPFCHVCS